MRERVPGLSSVAQALQLSLERGHVMTSLLVVNEQASSSIIRQCVLTLGCHVATKYAFPSCSGIGGLKETILILRDFQLAQAQESLWRCMQQPNA